MILVADTRLLQSIFDRFICHFVGHKVASLGFQPLPARAVTMIDFLTNDELSGLFSFLLHS